MTPKDERYVGPLRFRGHLNWKDIIERSIAGIISGLVGGGTLWVLLQLAK